jgi:hypothetical protein
MISILQIDPVDVRAANATALRTILRDVATNPEQARALQGSLILGFESFEREGVELTMDPLVMAYVRAAHAAVPHLFYFLAPEAPFGAVYFFLVSNASPDELHIQGGIPQVAVAGTLGDLLINHLAETARFAATMADDAEGILARLAEESGEGEMVQAAAHALVNAGAV